MRLVDLERLTVAISLIEPETVRVFAIIIEFEAQLAGLGPFRLIAVPAEKLDHFFLLAWFDVNSEEHQIH